MQEIKWSQNRIDNAPNKYLMPPIKPLISRNEVQLVEFLAKGVLQGIRIRQV